MYDLKEGGQWSGGQRESSRSRTIDEASVTLHLSHQYLQAQRGDETYSCLQTSKFVSNHETLLGQLGFFSTSSWPSPFITTGSSTDSPSIHSSMISSVLFIHFLNQPSSFFSTSFLVISYRNFGLLGHVSLFSLSLSNNSTGNKA